MTSDLDAFIAAAPWPHRALLALVVTLARRPRGRALLRLSSAIEQLAGGLLAMEHYEQPQIAAMLGWDAQAVSTRGLMLRRAEGRP